jgi:hypothetical protein
MGFLDFAGAAFLTGSNLAGRMRAERIEEERWKEAQKERAIRLALDQEAAAAQQEANALSRANMLSNILGPNGVVDDNAAQAFDKAGLSGAYQTTGTRASDDLTARAPVNFERTLRPTAEQADALEMRGLQRQQITEQLGDSAIARKARAVIESGDFFKMPPERQDAVWAQAGYGGNRPQSFAEWKQRQDYESQQRMKELGVMYPADRFGGTGVKDFASIYRTILYGAQQSVAQQARAAADAGQPFDANGAMRMAEEQAFTAAISRAKALGIEVPVTAGDTAPAPDFSTGPKLSTGRRIRLPGS